MLRIIVNQIPVTPKPCHTRYDCDSPYWITTIFLSRRTSQQVRLQIYKVRRRGLAV